MKKIRAFMDFILSNCNFLLLFTHTQPKHPLPSNFLIMELIEFYAKYKLSIPIKLNNKFIIFDNSYKNFF